MGSKTRSRLSLLRRVRSSLLATNGRTDNSIITECIITGGLVSSKGVPVAMKNNTKKRQLVYNRTNGKHIKNTLSGRHG